MSRRSCIVVYEIEWDDSVIADPRDQIRLAIYKGIFRATNVDFEDTTEE